MKVASRLDQVVWIDLKTFSEAKRGSLTVVQAEQDIPFKIARIFYIHGVPEGCERGAHAHRETAQVFIAMAGSLSLEVTDTEQTKTFALKEPHRAIYVPPMIWARLDNFSGDTVCLVLTSSAYDPADYIREWGQYVSAMKKC